MAKIGQARVGVKRQFLPTKLTTIATKIRPIYFSNDIGKMQLRSVASDW